MLPKFSFWKLVWKDGVRTEILECFSILIDTPVIQKEKETREPVAFFPWGHKTKCPLNSTLSASSLILEFFDLLKNREINISVLYLCWA